MSHLVKDYMSKEILTVNSETTITEASKIMREKNRWHVIVLKAGKPVGMATEKDFVSKIIAVEKNPAKVTVSEIMSSPLLTVSPDVDLSNAAEIMRKNEIRKLPVVKDEIIYGVITARDIVQHFEDYVNKAIREIVTYTFPLSF